MDLRDCMMLFFQIGAHCDYEIRYPLHYVYFKIAELF